ncbi:MAG: site-specific integrase [Pirellulaceae bacterium]|nr:site-specific integrase [Pirellulaceae bacterium]
MTTKKPSKPYDDFPLYAHNCGQWAKKIRGNTRYFGRFKHGWEAALKRFDKEKHALYAGHTPSQTTDELILEGACNWFIGAKMQIAESGDLSQRTLADYRITCQSVLGHFDRKRPVTSLTVADFESLRAALAAKYGPVRLSREITQVKMLFKYCHEAGHLEHPVKFGPLFKKPSAKILRAHRTNGPAKLFLPGGILQLVGSAGPTMSAMVWLGINAGYGNHDCGLLEFRHLDLTDGWITAPRHKTGIGRRAKLWPETIKAIEQAIAARPETDDEAIDNLVFVTKRRRSWYKTTRDNPVSKEFRKLLDQTGLYQEGRTFYALRHTFATVAGESRDQVAVNHIMGHAPAASDMVSVYRESISDERLEAVAQHVREWLIGVQTKKAGVQSMKTKDD